MNEQLQDKQDHALEVLHDAGAHWVLCERNKRAIWNVWQRRMPTLEVVQEHGGLVGLVPHSIGATALDVDRGDWRRLPRPWVNYPSRRKGGRHLYYSATKPRGNLNWKAAGCSGQVRGAKGYLIPWGDGLERLAVAIQRARQMTLFPFPDYVTERTPPVPVSRSDIAVVQASISAQAQPCARLELVRKGARQMALFDVLKSEAYAEIGQYRDTCKGSFSGWLFFIQDRAITHNKRFQLPLENSRAVSTAKAVAVWTWEKYWNHSPELQSKRQARQVVKRREKNATRDQAIAQAIEGGRTYRDVAREFRLSLGAIHRIVKRECSLCL